MVEQTDDRPARRSTVALYSDDLRFSIIKEVFDRPALWDNSNREPATVLQRKDLFEEISNNLKSFDDTLTASIVEKQWKNLKDTYNKVKKKVYVDENGRTVTPKWRFFIAMAFIDHDAVDMHSYDSSSKIDINRKRLNPSNEAEKLKKMLREPSAPFVAANLNNLNDVYTNENCLSSTESSKDKSYMNITDDDVEDNSFYDE